MVQNLSLNIPLMPRLLPSKYFKEPRMAKAKKLGAQQVMFWELLQKVRRPKDFLGCPRLLGSC